MSTLARRLNTSITTVARPSPMDAKVAGQVLSAANEFISLPTDAAGVVALDLRGTFNLSIRVEGTIDGINWVMIPMRPKTGGIFVALITGTAAGVWLGDCSGFRVVRAIVTARTSGSVTALMVVHPMPYADALQGQVTPSLGTTVGTAGAATTLTLASPGTGLRHYLTLLNIERFAAALLTAAAVPVTLTTTNLPGSLAFSMPADAAAQGTLFVKQLSFDKPVVASAQATATTIVCPATTGVIWRITAGFYVAP